jgi:hypothetical protein
MIQDASLKKWSTPTLPQLTKLQMEKMLADVHIEAQRRLAAQHKSIQRLTEDERVEYSLCKDDMAYFIGNYVHILNATDETWLPFDLWPAQRATLTQMHESRQLIILKARQLGLTWLCLAYALWRMIFYPIATIGIFSRREEDAKELLDKRLKGMYERLPAWMKAASVIDNNKTNWQLSTGSSAMAFATNGGRQYTFSLVMVDEADFQPDLPGLLTAVKPTIDAGGRMWLISSVNKDLPESRFKKIYRTAKTGSEQWRHIFLSWQSRPGRTPNWYEQQKIECMATTGALDDLHQEYPATDTEALAPRSLDKRISPMWIEACYEEMEPLDISDAPAIVGLEVYAPPQPTRQYVIGCDPAEGNPNSDDSALTVLDFATGEECAVLAGKFEPSTFGSHIAAMSAYYNHAPAMIERNNHGHAVLQWVGEHARRVRLLQGHDDKPGWMSSKLGKALLYTECADHFRLNAIDGTKILHSFGSYHQLASIEGNSLRAPDGMHDDRADSYALAQVGRAQSVQQQVNIVPQANTFFGARDTEPRTRGTDRGRLYGSRN